MRALHDLIDLVLPACCVCCGRPGTEWCVPCQPASTAGRVWPAHGPPAFAAGEYAQELRTALLHFKERGARRLSAVLAGYLADAVDVACRAFPSAATVGSAVLVPVPSRRAAARSRGGDHVVRLARAVSRQTGWPVVRPLRLTAAVADSAGLNPAERRANLSGRMAARAPVSTTLGSTPKVILLDDIVTTGTTAAEASRALLAAGWPPVTLAAIAATRLRRPDPSAAAVQPYSESEPDAEQTQGDFNCAEQHGGATV
ncbi:MAG TPA: hypothetical protein VHO01_00805 [Jatrophihabitans sp.]|nr:hypothetical protein [Jatrophihabitans sp.]